MLAIICLQEFAAIVMLLVCIAHFARIPSLVQLAWSATKTQLALLAQWVSLFKPQERLLVPHAWLFQINVCNALVPHFALDVLLDLLEAHAHYVMLAMLELIALFVILDILWIVEYALLVLLLVLIVQYVRALLFAASAKQVIQIAAAILV